MPSLFAALVAHDPSLPLLTYYDDVSGERTELSGATLRNWVSKTANLLVDGCGMASGSQATVWLPPHWQTATVLLGCWSAGLAVAYGEPTAAHANVEFASLEAVRAGAPLGPADRYVLGLAPMGAPLPDPPAGWTDYVTEVRLHGDEFLSAPMRTDAVALIDPDGSLVTHAALVERAREHAARLGMVAGKRVLIDADAYPYPVDWLVAPLAVGAPMVLCTHTDLAKLPARAESERTRLIGPTV